MIDVQRPAAVGNDIVAEQQITDCIVGSYDFKLVSAADTWRITAFRFNLKFIDGNVNLETDG